MPVSVSVSMTIGDDRDATVADRLEQVAVGHDAQALVPRVVARREMGVDVEVRRELALELLAEQPLHSGGPAATEAVDAQGEQHVLPAGDAVSQLVRQDAFEQPGQRVARGQRDDVAGRALEHRHVGGAFGERRDQRHRGRAAADDDHALAAVVGVLGPELRMHDLAPEAIDAVELGRVALVVAVVAGAGEEEAARQLGGLTGVGAFDLHGPARIVRRPLGADDAVVVADLVVDPMLPRRLADVVQDRSAVDDRPRPAPRAERIAEREHVRVRADAGIAEELPRPTAHPTRLEDRERLAWEALPQPAGSADAGEPGADDQDVDVFAGHAAQPTLVRSWRPCLSRTHN